jgi:NAD(P)-dependent dehydrogenase (short-subunit alcohol dehydrogenase family)
MTSDDEDGGPAGSDADGDAPPASTHPADHVDRPGAGGPETALVVGADAPAGRASALAFREEGWRVYATAAEEDDVADLAEHGCLTDGLDVAEATAARRLCKRVDREAGRLDCLVFGDADSLFGPVEELDVEAARAHLDRNVLGPLRLFQRALPGMRERGDGTVVVVTSVLAQVAAPGTGAYGAAQAAVGALCDVLRAEVADDGVDVVTVEPALLDADRGAPDWDPEATDYGWVYDLLADVLSLADDGPGVAPPERVGAAVVNAASATMPAPRYPVGAAADVLSKTRYLPDDWRDLLYGLVRRTAGRG